MSLPRTHQIILITSHIFKLLPEDIFLSTIEYSTECLMTYHSHISPVDTIRWNPYYPSLFISCASEPLVNIWHKGARLHNPCLLTCLL